MPLLSLWLLYKHWAMKARRTNLLLGWLTATALSVAVAIGFYARGKASDCTPHQIDGQCGMSTAMGMVEGLLVGGAIFLIATIFFAIAAARRESAEEQTNIMKSD